MPPNSELKPCLQYSYSYSLLPHSWLTLFTIFIQLFIAPTLLIDLVYNIHTAIHCSHTLDWPCLQYSYSYSLLLHSWLTLFTIFIQLFIAPTLLIDHVYNIHTAIHCSSTLDWPCLQYSYSYSLLPHFWLTLFTIFIQLFIASPLLIDLVPYIHAATPATPATPKKTLSLTTVVGLSCGIGGTGYCLVLVTLCIIYYFVSLRKMKK